MCLKAFILCAGEGVRFRPHTYYYPKSLLPFLNLPLISYNLYLLKTLGVTHFAANSYYHSDLIKNKLQQQAQLMNFLSPTLSHETTLLGSAGGLLKLKSFFETQDHFFYLNGDSFIWPNSPDSLRSFYSAHVESGALASFLVKPTNKTKGVIWADDKYQVCSFLKKPEDKKNIWPYDFSGLALFSSRVFKEISPKAKHIFKDVLEDTTLKKYLRVHNVSSLKFLDMNQESTYLKGTKQILDSLQKKTNPFLVQTLNACSPQWNRFQGDNYISVEKIKKPPKNKSDFLFCGRGVNNLEKLLVKNFVVLGDDIFVESDVSVNSCVIGSGLTLNTDLQNKFIIK